MYINLILIATVSSYIMSNLTIAIKNTLKTKIGFILYAMLSMLPIIEIFVLLIIFKEFIIAVKVTAVIIVLFIPGLINLKTNAPK